MLRRERKGRRKSGAGTAPPVNCGRAERARRGQRGREEGRARGTHDVVDDVVEELYHRGHVRATLRARRERERRAHLVALLPLNPPYRILEHHLARFNILADAKVVARKLVHGRVELDEREVDAVLREGARREAGAEAAARGGGSGVSTEEGGRGEGRGGGAHDEALLGRLAREVDRRRDEAHELLQDERRLFVVHRTASSQRLGRANDRNEGASSRRT